MTKVLKISKAQTKLQSEHINSERKKENNRRNLITPGHMPSVTGELKRDSTEKTGIQKTQGTIGENQHAFEDMDEKDSETECGSVLSSEMDHEKDGMVGGFQTMDLNKGGKNHTVDVKERFYVFVIFSKSSF